MGPASPKRQDEKLFGNMEPEVEYEIPRILRAYKDGRVEQFTGTSVVPPTAPDPATGVFSKDVAILPRLGVSARLYLPRETPPGKKLPVLVYYHGGAFCVESTFSPIYHGYLSSVVSRCGVVVVSVNYRLAPEHRLPAGYEDCWAALKWVAAAAQGGDGGREREPWLAEHADIGRIFIAGDSAGGNICHWVAIKAGEAAGISAGVGIEGMVLVHACFWGKQPLKSENPRRSEKFEKHWKFVCSPEAEAGKGMDHPWMNPWAEGAPSASRLGCRRVLILAAELDDFFERNWQYYDKLRESGWPGKVEIMEIPGERHVFHLVKPSCDGAKQMMDRLAVFVNGDGARKHFDDSGGSLLLPHPAGRTRSCI